MILVDTCVWIEFLKGHDPYFTDMCAMLERGGILGNELVFAELMQGSKTKREREIIASYWENIPKFSLDGVVFKAGQASSEAKYLDKGVGLIDVAILQYARDAGVTIWTIDKKLGNILKNEEKFK